MSKLDGINTPSGNKQAEYNPTQFSEQEASAPREYINPTGNSGTPSTLAAAFASLSGAHGLNTSSLLQAIQPALEAIKKETNIDTVTLSASEAPGIFADYIIPFIKVGNKYAITRLLLTRTVNIQLGSAEVPVGHTKVFVARNASDILDAKPVLEAVIHAFAAKVGASPNSVLPFGDMLVSDDLASFTPDALKATLTRYISARVVELNYIFNESSNSVLAVEKLVKSGYSRDLKVDSSKGDITRYTDVQGNIVPAHAVITVSIERNDEQSRGDTRNDRLSFFETNRGDSYSAASAAIILDLVRTQMMPSTRPDNSPATQFLAPNLVITQTNIGPAQGSAAGIASKLLAIVGSLIYARSNGSRSDATWFNLAVAQQQRFEQSGKNPKGNVSNWQVIPAYGYAGAPIAFDATKSEGAEMAEVLLDEKNGFIHPRPLISLDLSRTSNTASVDSILIDAFEGDGNAIAQVIAVMDNITGSQFSQYLGNAPFFDPGSCIIVPDGTAVLNGETISLREITTQSLATRFHQSNQSMEDWFEYQSSTPVNNATNYAAVYSTVFNGGLTNVNIVGTYNRLQLTNEFIAALEKSFFTERRVDKYDVGLRLVDLSKLKSYGNVGYSHSGGRSYTGGISSGNVSYGSYAGATHGYSRGGTRFTR